MHISFDDLPEVAIGFYRENPKADYSYDRNEFLCFSHAITAALGGTKIHAMAIDPWNKDRCAVCPKNADDYEDED